MNLNCSEICGRVVAVKGPGIIAALPYVEYGSVCAITTGPETEILARVVGFDDDKVMLAPFDVMSGVAAGQKVIVQHNELTLRHAALELGSIVNCFGDPLLCDRVSESSASRSAWAIKRGSPNPLSRRLIDKQFFTGINTIDALLPLGQGQRIGLFAGAGAGKSTLMGMMASAADVDVVVVGLIGERGRELREFLTDCLSEEARRRTTVVVATSDESAARRYLAAEAATAIAEFHRHAGKRVLLLIDSLTRVARALREMSLAAGELPVRQGYTASVYSELPILLERSGNNEHGSITSIYTVLMNGENDSDPLADEIKSLLDGHITLHASVAARGLRPAIEITQSISRVAGRVVEADELKLISSIQAGFSRLQRDRDIAAFGGQPDPELTRLLANEKRMLALLNQSITSKLELNYESQIKAKRRAISGLL